MRSASTRFDLLGISQGGAVAAAYAARHPGARESPDSARRVTRAAGFIAAIRGRSRRETALIKLVRLGWGRNNPAFRQIFTTRFIPDADRSRWSGSTISSRSPLRPRTRRASWKSSRASTCVRCSADIQAPTIVFHSEGDRAVPFDEGRLLAAGIPRREVRSAAEPQSSVLEHEPAWQILLARARRRAWVDGAEQLVIRHSPPFCERYAAAGPGPRTGIAATKDTAH